MSKTANTKSVSASYPSTTLPKKGDLTAILSSNGSKPSPMKGFDPQFQDIVDYIVKVTHEIWEERAIGKLYDYYGTNIRLHTSSGEIFSRDTVIEATIHALNAFPNRRLYAEEVIWSGNEADGYFSSHRLRHEGNNWGHTAYGDPTGKRVSYRAIADCKVVENVIVEEWLVRDELSLIRQLGFDPHYLARKFARADAERGNNRPILPSEPDRLRGQLPPQSNDEDASWESADFSPEQFVKNRINDIWNWRRFDKVKQYYREGYACESASDRRYHGHNQYIAYALSLLAPFPNLSITIDHFAALQEDTHRYRTATRWTMHGTHTGVGIYGKPTQQPIRIMGVTHHIIDKGQFQHEWTLFDEFALLKQINTPNQDDLAPDLIPF